MKDPRDMTREEIFRDRWLWASNNPSKHLEEYPLDYLHGRIGIECQEALSRCDNDHKIDYCQHCPIKWHHVRHNPDQATIPCLEEGSPVLEYWIEFNNQRYSRVQFLAAAIASLEWE